MTNRKIYIPFNKYTKIGGPTTFMANLKTYFDKNNYFYGNNLLFSDAIFFPISYHEAVLKMYRLLKRPVIQRLDGVYYPSKHGEGYIELNKKMKDIYLNYADFVVFQSEYSKKQCFEMFGEKPPDEYTVIHNGVNTDIFYPDEKPGFKTFEKINFITTGNFRNHDMIAPIIKALDLLKGQFDFKLTVVGPVINTELNQYLDREYTDVAGPKSMTEVAEFLRDSDIFLFSSLNPPCPNSVLEAVSSGLPVVGFGDGAMGELLPFSKELLACAGDDLFKKSEHLNPSNLAEKIYLCVKNFTYYKQHAITNYKAYSFEKCANAYIKIFDNILLPNKPEISVVMAVYNGEKYLKEAVESILNQTFKDFEFLIINDASTDSTREIILSYGDTRIKLLDNEVNSGLSASLNRGIDAAHGKYIARMDADDISRRKRLEIQYDFMEKNPDIGVCGSRTRTFGRKYKTVWNYPEHHEEIKAALFFHCCMVHPAVMIKKSVLSKSGIRFDESLDNAVDYDLWVKLIDFTGFHNLQEVLLDYRIHKNQLTGIDELKKAENTGYVRKKQLEKLGITDDTALSNEWLKKLLEHNEAKNYVDEECLIQAFCNNCNTGLSGLMALDVPVKYKLKALYTRFILKYYYLLINFW